jgi:sporulation protein YqfC
MREDFSIVTMHGNYEVYVENFVKVLDFGREVIRIKAKKQILEISGQELYVEYMNKEYVKICGLIENIKFTGVLS